MNAAKILSPWIFSLEIRISAPDINIQDICQYLYNLISLKVRCAEGKNLDYKKKIVGMKFTEARDIAETLKDAQNLVIDRLCSLSSTLPATSSMMSCSNSSFQGFLSTLLW